MGSHWPALMGCLCILMASGESAVVPTQDTLIITKSEDTSSEPTMTSTMADPTTEGPLPPIKLLEMHVVSEIALRYSRTAVTTLVKNPAKRSQETTFSILLPETAFISGFSMTIEGKKYDAYVKEKEEAKQIYSNAVSQGVGAAHIATKARDSNHFTVSTNVEPNSVALFNLTYEELLVRRNGVYQQAINLNPGSVVPNITVVVQIKEAQKITTIRVPEITTGNEIAPTENDAQNTKALITRSSDDREVTVVFKPDLDEQKRLMEIYAQKSKESRANSHSWYEPEEEMESNDGVLGQIVVQYDVDRTAGNEVLVNDGYFVHFFAPTDLPPLEKHVVFVLDTSGSMMDRKIQQLREAMQLILGELHKGDYFSIVEFSSSVTVHDLKEADEEVSPLKPYYLYDEEPKPTKQIPPFPATPENIAKAKIIVGRLSANGGTNIADALSVATDLVHKGVGWKESTNPAIIDNTTVADTKPDNKKVEGEINKGGKELEPMIIFLTDGEPTVGETDPKRIIRRLSEMNYGERKATIFSLAFGDDADRKFLRKLSLINNGFSRHIYEAADAVLQLRDFYQQVTSPLMSHVNFTYSPNQVQEDSLTKSRFRTYYAGSEVVVAGLLNHGVSEISPKVSGFCGVDDGFTRKLYEIYPKITVTKENHEYLPLERLWAYLTIKQLLDERDAAEDLDKPKKEKEAPEKKALEIALKYSFVTDLTSLVVVKPNDTKAVNAESVDKPDFQSFGGVQLSALHGGIGLPGAPGAPSGPAAPAAFGISALSRPSLAFSSHAFVSSALSYLPQIESDAIDESVRDDFVTTPFMAVEGETEIISSRVVYNLEQYPWTQPLLNPSADELVIQVNGTDVHLKLSKDFNVSESLGDAVPCSVSTDGAAGSCVYLTRCEAARNISAELYTSTYCLIHNQYAGVCCPDDKLSGSTNISPITTISATESNPGDKSVKLDSDTNESSVTKNDETKKTASSAS